MTIRDTAGFFEVKEINPIKIKKRLITEDNVVQISIGIIIIIGIALYFWLE